MSVTCSTYRWATRTIPIWSLCAVILIIIFAYSTPPWSSSRVDLRPAADSQASLWQIIISVYTVVVHLLAIGFPLRVIFAFGDVMRHMRESAATYSSSTSDSASEASYDEKDLIKRSMPIFVIILPAYKEEIHTLLETLRVLASHPQARQQYHIYLAMEQREERSAEKARTIIKRLDTMFYRMSYTVHPQGIDGEAPGKSSNESWAARQACRDYADDAGRDDIIFTTMDADTHFSQRYFAQIADWHNADSLDKHTTMYMPPIVFDRNLRHVPLMVRTADTLWAGAGISSFYDGATVCIPTSVYSLPMTLVEHVGGWDTDAGAIGEDLHMYLKCFFALNGNLRTRVVYAAASQCNVSSDLQGIRGYVDGLKARYNQALRHMWGALDSGFSARQLLRMVGGRGEPIDMMPQSSHTTYDSDTDNSMSQDKPEHQSLKMTSSLYQPQRQHISNNLTIMLRLFEAHFMPVHLVVILVASSIYSQRTPIDLVPHVLKVALDVSAYCRFIGYVLMLGFFWRFQAYHKLCVSLRKEEMSAVGLLQELEDADGFSSNLFQLAGLAEAATFPVGGVIFGALPALQAIISHVFTERIAYIVSLKPQIDAMRLKRSVSP